MQVRLVGLAAFSMLPMLLLFVGFAYLDYNAERERAGQRALTLTRSMAATVESELTGAQASLRALALAQSLQTGNLDQFRLQALRFIVSEPEGSALVLMDRAGQQLLNTRAQPGRALPRRAPRMTEELNEKVFANGHPVISNLFRSALDGELTVAADVPVLRDGVVAYDLSLLLPVERFVEILQTQRLPAEDTASVVDRSGVTVARIPQADRFIGQAVTPGLLPALLSQADGVLSTGSLSGVQQLTVFSHTAPSGWAVTMGIPEARLRTDLLRSLKRAVVGACVALLVSSAVATLLGRRLLQPIRALTRFAADPTVDRHETFGLAEIDAVATALRASLRDRQAAMNDLQTLNESLEVRVRQETATRVRAQEQLAQGQRMEALGQLAGGVAHDFNNVLQAVNGGLSLILRRADEADAVRRLATMAANAAARGAAITGRLLTFARRGELAASVITPHTLLESMREMLTHTLGTAITICVDASPSLPCLVADGAQLETVLVNLAVNARDAMPHGGLLTLSARADQLPPTCARPDGLKPGAYIRISLSDTGVGMSPDILARACEPFFTTKEPGQGTGLGLAMARGFAQQSGGAFALDSTLAVGTVAELWLPQADRSAPSSPAQPEPVALNTMATPMRVLLVDDDAMVREVMASELDARGFLVTTAIDGPAALALLDGGQQTELLITDYTMPGMNGLALIEECRRRRPALPALLLTGHAEAAAEVALSAAQDRLTLLLYKPIGGEELATRAAGLRRRQVI